MRSACSSLLAALALGVWGATAVAPPPRPPAAQQANVVAALRRLTWGIAPGDVAAVEEIGLERWINLQLHPNDLPENAALTAALQPLDTLRMSPAEIIATYPPPQVIRQMAKGRRPLPRDPHLRLVVETQIQRLRLRKSATPVDRKREGSLPVVMGAPPLAQALGADTAQALVSGPPRKRAATFAALPTAQQRAALASLPRAAARQMEPWLPLADARTLAYQLAPQSLTTFDLDSGKLLRAVDTTRQLQDVLTDFWFNHFNIYIRKNQESVLLASYIRDAIRPHVLGKFHDLLLATAESPAMMLYLDNWRSVNPAINKRGINENYGRELMELHTLGVGHYTQADVIAVADCLTGWTIRQPLRQSTFFYNPRLHDPAPQTVLGVRISADSGMDAGLKILDMLAKSPATAHHLSYELAQRFVADEPPPALVARMAQAYLHSDGDLRKVMETMINSPEFWQAAAAQQKIKSPLQFVVSAVRATGAQLDNPQRLAQLVGSMGEPLYGHEEPNGYGNTSDVWASSASLVARMQFAQQLARNQVPGVAMPSLASPLALLHQPPSAQLQAVLARTPAVPQQTALILGSPQFQRR